MLFDKYVSALLTKCIKSPVKWSTLNVIVIRDFSLTSFSFKNESLIIYVHRAMKLMGGAKIPWSLKHEALLVEF